MSKHGMAFRALDDLREVAVNVCRQVASSRGIFAACFYGSLVCGYQSRNGDVNVLLVLEGYPPRLMSQFKSLNGTNLLVVAVDRWVFERDIERGWLGEFVAEALTVPYEPLVNEEYFWSQEVKVKKRIVCELLENIVLEYPELSHELLIKPEYFMYEVMMRRARVFPPITYSFLNMLRRDLKKTNIERIMKGYYEALRELASEKRVVFFDGYVRISPEFISKVKKRKLRMPPIFRSIQKAALLYIFNVLPKTTNLFTYDQSIFFQWHRRKKSEEELALELEKPEKYFLIPTSHGLVPFTNKTGIEDFAKKLMGCQEGLEIEMEELGGVLNSVYLLTIRRNHVEQKVVVKKFKDWLDFKWFPLALWTLGAKTFAVLGRTRLEKEYAINQFLQNNRVCVPKILHVSPQERLIFQEYVQGENMAEIIKQIIAAPNENTAAKLDLIRKTGEEIAKVHSLGVALGDCKPENIVVQKTGAICFLDHEQATRNGNQAWDIAEFLYYAGHYASLLSSTSVSEAITKAFIEGYLNAGGNRKTVKEAGSAKYTKVFSIFTPPHILLAISNLCKQLGRE
ncbi:MAG: lipopolysaccharide kinase InaA family protein [Candidatus Bathyarchaeia archaeon]